MQILDRTTVLSDERYRVDRALSRILTRINPSLTLTRWRNRDNPSPHRIHFRGKSCTFMHVESAASFAFSKSRRAIFTFPIRFTDAASTFFASHVRRAFCGFASHLIGISRVIIDAGYIANGSFDDTPRRSNESGIDFSFA